MKEGNQEKVRKRHKDSKERKIYHGRQHECLPTKNLRYATDKSERVFFFIYKIGKMGFVVLIEQNARKCLNSSFLSVV